MFGILGWNKDMEILVFSLYDTFIEQWTLITFLSNHMLFQPSPVLRCPSFCRILSRQYGWEARFRLSYIRERTVENGSDQENLTLKKKEIRLGSGSEEGRENLQLGLSLTSLPSPNPSSYTFTLSLTSPILCKDMQKTDTYKPQMWKLKQQYNILEGFQICEEIWSKAFQNKYIFIWCELLTAVIISRIDELNYRFSITWK